MSIATDLRFQAGEAVSLTFSPITSTSISGWTLRFRAYTAQGGTLKLTKTIGSGITVTNASTGAFTVALTATDTSSTLTAAIGYYYYDVWRTDLGSETELANGSILIRY
jgi:hypothetical protein